MEVSLAIDDKSWREYINSLRLTPVLIKKNAAKVLRSRFKQFQFMMRLFHFSGPASKPPAYRTPVGRLGMSDKPGRYGHLAEQINMKFKQAPGDDNFGMYARNKATGEHGFILPMHEFGTGERFRKTRKGPASTGVLPARHPWQSSVDAFLQYVNLEKEIEDAIDKGVKRAMKSGARK